MAKKKYQEVHIQIGDMQLSFKTQVVDNEDYISITDIVKSYENGEQVLYNWIRNRNTIDFLGTWELLNSNEHFDKEAFLNFQNESGRNTFTMSPKKWVEATKSIGIYSKSGRYGGGTYAHKDIALEFCSWLDASLKLYIIKEFQRLKIEENERLALDKDWSTKRFLSKVNYHIHTDAVKAFLLPQQLVDSRKDWVVYATEADLLNLALFGTTAKEWRSKNPEAKGNLRDQASSEQLLVLANLESLNAEYIRMGYNKEERLQMLNSAAIYQMSVLLELPLNKHLDFPAKD